MTSLRLVIIQNSTVYVGVLGGVKCEEKNGKRLIFGEQRYLKLFNAFLLLIVILCKK